VFLVPDDPVEFRLVVSLSRPGGNLTGVNLVIGVLTSKQLALLRELVPGHQSRRRFIVGDRGFGVRVDAKNHVRTGRRSISACLWPCCNRRSFTQLVSYHGGPSERLGSRHSSMMISWLKTWYRQRVLARTRDRLAALGGDAHYPLPITCFGTNKSF
jgi:hypothetical protein